MTTQDGLKDRHEHLMGGVMMLREARANLVGAIDRTGGDTLMRVQAALKLTNHALAEQEEAAGKVTADIFAETDTDKIDEAEEGHQVLTARYQHQAESQTPDREEDDG